MVIERSLVYINLILLFIFGNIYYLLSLNGHMNDENTTPAIFFHGTDDNLVPYATAAHHYCEKSQPGYLILDGSRSIANRLKELNTAYLLYTFKGAKHEISSIPFDYLPEIFSYVKDVFLENNFKQTEVVID